MQASVVEHKTYDELEDIVAAQGRDLEGDFIPETVEMAINSCDEQWRMQWDAVQNLRILNKFYYGALEASIEQFSNFLKG